MPLADGLDHRPAGPQSIGLGHGLCTEFGDQQSRNGTEQPTARKRVRLDVTAFEQCYVGIFKRLERRPAYTVWHDVLGDRPEDRLRRDRTRIEFIEPLAPPGEADLPEHRLGGRSYDLNELQVQRMQREDRGADGLGCIQRCDVPIGITGTDKRPAVFDLFHYRG